MEEKCECNQRNAQGNVILEKGGIKFQSQEKPEFPHIKAINAF